MTDALTTESVWDGASEAALSDAFDDLTRTPTTSKAAKQLVEEAGVDRRGDRLVTAPISSDFNVIAQATAAAAESIGLKANIETITPNAYTALFSDPSAREGVDLFYTSWYLSSPDPLEMYACCAPASSATTAVGPTPSSTQVVNEAIAIDDPAARSEKTAEAQRIANEELPWLPLYNGPMPLFLGERITGVAPSIAFLYYPWAATIGAR